MKAYTNEEQSKVLAKILPSESADMFWYRDAVTKEANPRIMDYMQIPVLQRMYYSPCWSLDALLDYLKQRFFVRLEHDGISWSITCIEHDTNKKYTSNMFDCPVDACLGMILRLNGEEGK